MPPKPRLHKSKGKKERHTRENESERLNSSDSNDNSLNFGTIDTQVQEQFEVELCWCIQQLQIAVNSSKLSPKQVQEHRRALNTLMSNSSSFVKKRQVMRLTFGDYRAKMMEQDKKISKALNMKISPSSAQKNSKFIKKAFSSTNNKFNFNFKVEVDGSDHLPALESEAKVDNSFRFSNSSNSFRFNFNNDEN